MPSQGLRTKTTSALRVAREPFESILPALGSGTPVLGEAWARGGVARIEVAQERSQLAQFVQQPKPLGFDQEVLERD